MATAKPAAGKTAPKKTASSDFVFVWTGKDKSGQTVKGEMRAAGETQVSSALRRQGVTVTSIKKRKMKAGAAIKPKTS